MLNLARSTCSPVPSSVPTLSALHAAHSPLGWHLRTCRHVPHRQHKGVFLDACPVHHSCPSTQTRMQVFSASPAAVYDGVGSAFKRISSTEGIRALWRGVSSVVLGAGPAHAVHFGTLEMVKDLAGGNEAGNQWLAHCASLPFTPP